jgi:hypothetical protein
LQPSRVRLRTSTPSIQRTDGGGSAGFESRSGFRAAYLPASRGSLRVPGVRTAFASQGIERSDPDMGRTTFRKRTKPGRSRTRGRARRTRARSVVRSLNVPPALPQSAQWTSTSPTPTATNLMLTATRRWRSRGCS